MKKKKEVFGYDFADEAYKEENEAIRQHAHRYQGVIARWIELLKDDEIYGKKKGNYISLEVEDIHDETQMNALQLSFSKTIRKLLKLHHYTKKKKVLVVGLGNDSYSSDALGPMTIDAVHVTSHLEKRKTIAPVATIAPGVMSSTGMETAKIIHAIVK